MKYSGRVRRLGLLALAFLGGACVRLNPAYGDDAQGMSGSGGGSSSSSTTESTSTVAVSSGEDPGSTTATPDPGFECEEPGFDIQLDAAIPTCPSDLADVILDRQCVLLSDWGGNTLRGRYASGCSQGLCTSDDMQPFELKVDGLDLPTLFGPVANDEVRCGWIRLHGTPRGDGSCTYDRLEVWEVPGDLRLAIGNGPPDVDPMIQRPLSGNPIPINSFFHSETACGDLSPCDRSGFRGLVVGTGMDAASPDGVPVPATLPVVSNLDDTPSYSVFNWGLQYDRSCKPWGRWGVVPSAHATLFD